MKKTNKRNQKRLGRRLVYALAAIVVFSATYALVLPAVTLDEETAVETPGIELEAAQAEILTEGEVVTDAVPLEETAAEELPAETVEAVMAETVEEPAAAEPAAEEPAAAPAEQPAEVTKESTETAPAVAEPVLRAQKFEEKLYASEADKASNNPYLTVSVEADPGAFPEETTMKVVPVVDQNVLNKLTNVVEGSVVSVTAVDITFYNKEGFEIEPAIPIRVTMTGKEIADADDMTIVHMDDYGQTNIVNQTDKNLLPAQPAENQVVFDSNEFSTYGLVGTTLEGTVLTSDGQSYKITAVYGPETGIPAFANLSVEEITEATTDYRLSYESYVALAENALGWEEGTASFARLFNICIVDPNDPTIKYQPAAGTTVDVKIELDDKDGEKTAKVVHIADGANEGSVVNAETKGQEVSFAADGFSIYAVIENGEDPTIRATYIFQNANGTSYTFKDSVGNTVDNQIIKNGEYLEDVGRPNVDPGETFAGWYVYNPETGTYGDQIQFGPEYPISVTENATYYVRPVFGDVAYINFYEDSEGTNIFQRVQVALTNGSATYDISTQSVNAPKSNLAFMGWSTQPGTDNDGRTVITNTNVTITQDTNYYPVYKSAHWIHFNANPDGQTGASYTAPKFVLLGQTAASARPTNPTWKGHSFQYWSETKPIYNENGVLQNNPPEFNFNQLLDDREGDVELYAVWANADTTYTVIFWKQRVTDDKNASDANKTFDYAGQETQHATSGTTVNASDYENQYTGFTVNTAKSDTSITIKADGSSVLNVYFNRKLLTMQFYKNNNDTNDPGYNSNYWTNGSNRVTTYTGLYGQTLAQNGYSWPEGIWTYYSSSTGTTGMSYLGQFVFPTVRDTAGLLFRAYQSSTNNRQRFRYYLEQADGTYALIDTGYADKATSFEFTEKFDGYNVSSYQRFRAGYYSYRYAGWPTYDYVLDVWTAETGTIDNNRVNTHEGDTVDLYNQSGNTYYNYRLHLYSMDVYYNLSSHSIKFLDPTDNTVLTNVTFTNTGANPVTAGVGNVKYTASLTNYQPPSSIIPVSQSPGKVWDGKWYADQACTVEFDWSQTMPNDDVRVFAGWTDEWYRVEIDPNGGELSSTESTYFWSKYGGKVQQYNDISRNYIEDPDGEYYYLINSWDPSWPDSADGDPAAARIAEYSTSGSVTIGDVTVTNDGKKYSFKQDAYSLVGWYRVNADGSLGDPYDFSEEITANVKIRAVWRMVGEFRVVYDVDAVDESGNPLYKEDESGQPTTERVQATSVPTDNNSYADKSETATLGKAGDPEGYVFQGWYYNGRILNPGDVFTVLAELADDQDKVHLQPVFLPYDQVPVRNTHIYWYTNTKDINGNTITTELSKTVTTTADTDPTHASWGEYYAQPDLQLNANVPILGEGAYSYEGYEFIGWAKSPDATTPWLLYDSATGKFSENGEVVNYVAADEKLPYDDLFALWRVKTYTVTINKEVVGLEADADRQFTFTSTALQQANYGLKHGENKVFEEVPYGTVFTLTEETGGDAAAFTPSVVSVLTKEDGTETTTTPENGAEYTVTGDLSITYTNTRSKQIIKVFKVETGTTKGLEGAIFDLTGPEGSDISYTGLTTDPDGWLVLDGETNFTLPTNRSAYTLEETKAPDGYYLVGDNTTFTVSADNVVGATEDPDNPGTFIITVQNSTGVELPHTGGSGTLPYTLGGLALLAVSALMYGFRLRRRERRVK